MRHISWNELQPFHGENLANDKSYYDRIDKRNNSHIPNEVIHQWIFPHFNEPNSVKNYSWIDLSTVKFRLEEHPTAFFQDLNVIEDNREMVLEYTANKFALWHRKYWEINGTWEIPPIIIDANSFISKKPSEAELGGTYQLVEGHNRLGTLFLLIRNPVYQIMDRHKVWVISKSHICS